MPRRSALPSSAHPDSPVERLTVEVEGLAQKVEIVADILNDIHEDLSWLTRNGVPHQELLVRVDRFPLNPATKNWTRRVKVTQTRCRDAAPATGITQCSETLSVLVDELVQQIAEPLGVLAQEQLNILLGALESARREIETAIRQGPNGSVKHAVNPTSAADPTTDSAEGEFDAPPPGSLF